MADSFLRFDVGSDWVDVETLTVIPIGTGFEIQVTGGYNVDAAISIIEPVGDIGEVLVVKRFYGIYPGEDKLWIKADAINTTSRIAIKINGPFDPSGDYAPADYSEDYSQDI